MPEPPVLKNPVSNPHFKAWHLLSRQLGQFKTHLPSLCLLPLCWNWGSRQTGLGVLALLKVAKTADDAWKRMKHGHMFLPALLWGWKSPAEQADGDFSHSLPPPRLIHSSLSANTHNYANALSLKLICWAVPEAMIGLAT